MNIVDGTNASNVAKVDTAGALKTSGNVSGSVMETPPKTQFRHVAEALEGAWRLTPQTSATLALSRIGITNHQEGGLSFDISVQLVQRAADAAGCTGPTRELGVYYVRAGQTVIDPLPVSMLLKPLSGSPQWCLQANTTVIGDTGGYYIPRVMLHGYVVSGSYSGTTSAARVSARPRKHVE